MKSCDCFICNGFFYNEEDCDCDVNQDAAPVETNKHVCKPKEYIGILERYFYCEDCGNKMESK